MPGVESGFAEFAGAHWRRLWRMAWLLTAGDSQAAEDLVQSALENTLPHAGKLHTDDERRAYVYRVMVRAIARDRRRRRSDVAVTESVVDEVQASGEDGALVRLAVAQALATLPARQRAALVLRYFTDLNEPSVAAAMGCSVGTAKTHIRRGLASLRHSPALANVLIEEDA